MPSVRFLPGEQLVGSVPSPERPQDPHRVRISDLSDMAFAALPDEVELGRAVPSHDDVLPPEGGQTVGAIVRIVLSADPEEASVQEPNRTGEYAFAGITAPAKIGVDPSAQGP